MIRGTDLLPIPGAYQRQHAEEVYAGQVIGMHNRVRQTGTVLGGHGRQWEVWSGSLQHYFCKLSYDMDWVYTIKNPTWTIAMGIEAIQIRTFVFRHLPSPSPFLLSMQIPRRPLDSPKHVVSYYLSFDHKCVRIPPLPKRSFISYSMI